MSSFGWCQGCTETNEGQYHGLCRITYRTQFGVPQHCGCPRHPHPGDDT